MDFFHCSSEAFGADEISRKRAYVAAPLDLAQGVTAKCYMDLMYPDDESVSEAGQLPSNSSIDLDEDVQIPSESLIRETRILRFLHSEHIK